MTGPRTGISRRRFLKATGVAAAVAIPSLAGCGLLMQAGGESPLPGSPDAAVALMENWPAHAVAASPILILVNDLASNPFGSYLAEILRAEGLNCFQMANLADLDHAPLDWYDLILLAEGPLNLHQAELLQGYVVQGGRLVAMRPDARLAPILGVEPMAGNTAEGYLKVDSSHPVARGITDRAMQFHGAADHCRPDGAHVVAWLASEADIATALPAVCTHRHGQGQTAMWAFDLAQSVAYTRQGNPAWAGQERDGLDGLRITDMTAGWVDLERLSIPQADEQQRLLANLLSSLCQDARPLPRLWYFPGDATSMLVATGDAHGNSPEAIEEVLSRVEDRGGHMSIYYTAYPSSDLKRRARKALLTMTELPLVGDCFARQYSSPTPAQVGEWRQRGHEFALHPYVEEGIETGWLRYWEEFTSMGYGPVSPTTRTHRVLWEGWVETVRFQASHGMRLNLDTYHLGPAFQTKAGEWKYGYFTGSSLPMRFVDEQGHLLNIYQQATLLADEHLLDMPWVGGTVPALAAADAVEVSGALLQQSLDGAYGAITTQFHVDPYAIGGQAASDASFWLEGTLNYAAAQGIPIWSALEWLQFTEARQSTSLVNLEWRPTQQRLSFDLASQATPDLALTVMLPLHHGNGRLTGVEVDGMAVRHWERAVGGVSYGSVSAPAGSHRVEAGYA